MTLITKIDNGFNNFYISTSIGFFSGGVIYFVVKDLINKKYTPLTLYTISNKGAVCGFMLGLTRWYLQKPVLDYFLK